MLFLLISIALAQQLEYFTDANFQKRTLISKHYVQYDWVIAFCDQECPNETIATVNSFPDSYQKGFVNLSNSPWIKNNIAQNGIWIYYLNNTMCEFQNGHCDLHLPVPQKYNIPKVNFFESRMVLLNKKSFLAFKGYPNLWTFNFRKFDNNHQKQFILVKTFQ